MTNQVIWKFPMTLSAHQIVEMPDGAQTLHVAEQYGKITLWALASPDMEKRQYIFYVVGTGHAVPAEAGRYLGTAHVDGFVWHVFAHRGV